MRKIQFPKRLTKKQWLLIAMGALVIILLLLLFARSAAIPNIATMPVQSGEFVIDLKERGELFAVKSISVGVPMSVRGNLRIVALAQDGSLVQKDDFLVQFDTSEAMQRVEEEKSNLENAQAEFASLQANINSTMAQLKSAYETQKYSLEQAKLRLEQMKYEAAAKLREQELNLKKAELALEQAKKKIESQEIIDQADLRKANLKIRKARLELEEKQKALENLTLRAPLGGLVVLQEIWGTNGLSKIKIGDTPWRGMTLVEIPDLSQMMAKAKINEVNISQVKVGQQVLINMDAIPGLTLYGKVTRVATLASRERGSNVKNFETEILIDGADPRLRPGMTAQCRIITDRIADKLFVPLESVFQKDDTTVVYIKKANFQRREVKIGAKNSDMIVIEGGLKKNEQVALRDPTTPLQELGGEGPAIKEKKKSKSESSGEGGMIIIG